MYYSYVSFRLSKLCFLAVFEAANKRCTVIKSMWVKMRDSLTSSIPSIVVVMVVARLLLLVDVIQIRWRNSELRHGIWITWRNLNFVTEFELRHVYVGTGTILCRSLKIRWRNLNYVTKFEFRHRIRITSFDDMIQIRWRNLITLTQFEIKLIRG